MFKVLLFAFASIFLCGCDPVSSDLARAMQMQQGQLRIEPSLSASDGYDYTVTFPVMVDFGFNTRNHYDRVRYVNGVMQPQCASIRIVNERETIVGKFPNGNDRIQYSVYVDCV